MTAILTTLTAPGPTAAALFAGVAGCLLVAVGILSLFGRGRS